jgi:uncharacterized protein
MNEEVPAVITEEFLRALREHGVVRAELFGSSPRGTMTPDSDVDLLVTFDRPVRLFAQLRLADTLRDICGRPVDLVTRLHPAFRPYIEPELMLLPV